jgi:putative alpha-1,2-mannosidase
MFSNPIFAVADGNVTGFSMMHESGTGGAPKYGVVSQMPVVGNLSNPLVDLGVERSENDTSSIGYYHSSLVNGVDVQLAGTAHAGFYNYTFPSEQISNVVVDVSHVLPSFRGLGWGQNYAGGNITIEKDGSYRGSGIYNGGWNLGEWLVLCNWISR